MSDILQGDVTKFISCLQNKFVQKNVCVTLMILILLKVTHSSTMYRERIVAYPS